MLEKRIDQDCNKALKERDAIRVSTLRMFRAEILNTKIKLNKKEFSDEDVIKIAQRMAKQHRDSIEAFKKGNRLDLAEKEEKELAIILSYIPEKLSEQELRKLIQDAISSLGAASKKDMGNVIKAVLEKSGGKADGKTVSEIVKELLP